ncbi:hypothetical protein FEMY_19750 [Ferrovum myxofaciens]|jgi:ATP-dependent DNA helicase RecG|uniref:Uncharacterized protein n=1 Tax=Ferrovum myxofaciens TaxID=416213 RepID=A0A149VWF4_9PROT|nr:ATP-binding protein [Ferrovum myxofaciens]KXW57516.1 hypothetical protein FEMY_19750 [Ferrovum myxofaciens]
MASKIGSLEIDIKANIARLSQDMQAARNEVQKSTRGIQGHVAEMQKNIREHMEGVKKSLEVFKVLTELGGITEIGAKLLELGKSAAEYGMELIEAVWQEVPDFREHYELPDGLYRQNVPAFDEIVVRELLVNALVHRPYTQRGDIFLNLHPDRLEIVNPGPLPLGVTPQNVLHTTVRRNEHLARLFHDLKLMEREGSGFDKIFEVLLSQGRPAPELIETHDRVQVTVRRRILKPEVINFIAKADQTYQLTQRERIALGLLAQHDALTARELTATLELPSVEALQPWLKRLLDWQLVQSAGRTQSTRYFIDPALLRNLDFVGGTTLKRIEPHRLLALIVEDIGRYPQSKIGDIHQRIGLEIPRSRIRRGIEQLLKNGKLHSEGVRSGTRYRLP